MSKRFCIHGHDTLKTGRNKHSQCLQCKRDKKKLTREQLKAEARERWTKIIKIMGQCASGKFGFGNQCSELATEHTSFCKNHDPKSRTAPCLDNVDLRIELAFYRLYRSGYCQDLHRFIVLERVGELFWIQRCWAMNERSGKFWTLRRRDATPWGEERRQTKERRGAPWKWEWHTFEKMCEAIEHTKFTLEQRRQTWLKRKKQEARAAEKLVRATKNYLRNPTPDAYQLLQRASSQAVTLNPSWPQSSRTFLKERLMSKRRVRSATPQES